MQRIKRFNKFGVTLDLFDIYTRAGGKDCLAYELRVNRKVIFKGSDFWPSPLHTIDSMQTVRSLLNFLTLRPGDTDAESFDNYTQAQRDFIDSDACDNLRLYLSQFPD